LRAAAMRASSALGSLSRPTFIFTALKPLAT
jgi:hypothetical protein